MTTQGLHAANAPAEPATASRPWGLLAMHPPHLAAALYGRRQREDLSQLLQVDHGLVAHDLHAMPADVLERTEVLLTGWNPPRVDDDVLDRMPNLHLVAHAGGGVPGTDLLERRGIVVVGQTPANAIPTAEFSVAMILLANIRAFRAQRLYHQMRTFLDREEHFLDSGNYESRVGIVGAGHVGRTVISLLQGFDLDLMVTDPSLDEGRIAALGARKVELPELLATSDVVSLHVSDTAQTAHLLGASELARMRDGATLVNTARGRIVDQDALVSELTTGRIDAVLDVTEPDVLDPDHPFYDLPNVVLTPHVAGSMGRELHRLADRSIRAVRHHLGTRRDDLTPDHDVSTVGHGS